MIQYDFFIFWKMIEYDNMLRKYERWESRDNTKKQNQGIKIEVNCQNDQLVNCERTNQPTIGQNVADSWPTLANLDQHALKFWRNDGQFVRKL